jgi:multisubunit Na+/H+ antiporter MnhF subunit
VIDAVYAASAALLALSALLVLGRLWRGPSVFDRALALETLALVVVGSLLLQAYTPAGRLYTDAALALALFSFVGTVLLGFFLGRGDFPDE